jgi:hypothetical protein
MKEGVMKCDDIDPIACLEGQIPAGMEGHLAACPACREDLERFALFMNGALPAYCEGKRQEADLDRRLAEMDPAGMKPLPPEIARKVKALMENSIVSRLNRAFGQNREKAREWIESMLQPQVAPMPAIPKDLLRPEEKKQASKPAKPKQKRKQAEPERRKPAKAKKSPPGKRSL